MGRFFPLPLKLASWASGSASGVSLIEVAVAISLSAMMVVPALQNAGANLNGKDKQTVVAKIRLNTRQTLAAESFMSQAASGNLLVGDVSPTAAQSNFNFDLVPKGGKHETDKYKYFERPVGSSVPVPRFEYSWLIEDQNYQLQPKLNAAAPDQWLRLTAEGQKVYKTTLTIKPYNGALPPATGDNTLVISTFMYKKENYTAPPEFRAGIMLVADTSGSMCDAAISHSIGRYIYSLSGVNQDALCGPYFKDRFHRITSPNPLLPSPNPLLPSRSDIYTNANLDLVWALPTDDPTTPYNERFPAPGVLSLPNASDTITNLSGTRTSQSCSFDNTTDGAPYNWSWFMLTDKLLEVRPNFMQAPFWNWDPSVRDAYKTLWNYSPFINQSYYTLIPSPSIVTAPVGSQGEKGYFWRSMCVDNRNIPSTQWQEYTGKIIPRLELLRSGLLGFMVALEADKFVTRYADMGLIRFDSKVEPLVDFERAVTVENHAGVFYKNLRDKLSWFNRYDEDRGTTNNPADPSSKYRSILARGATATFDALENARTKMSTAPYNSKTVILVTDGAPFPETGNNTPTGLTALARNLRDEGVTLHIIGFSGIPAAKVALMQTMATTTGGQYFTVENGQQLKEIFKSLSATIRFSIVSSQVKRYSKESGGFL